MVHARGRGLIYPYGYICVMNINPRTLKHFTEKATYMLSYIYENGGSEFKPLEFNSILSRSICGCDHSNEFERVMISLLKQEWVSFVDDHDNNGGVDYKRVLLTRDGNNEATKLLPKIPMIGLVNQEVITGDITVDEKINHARKLFFKDGATLDDMRSACETLSFVLEPLRDDLKLAITTADVEAFFQIVNKFDIRHNKPHTINLVHPEQFEWVFYSLLNTINTYTKLKARITP